MTLNIIKTLILYFLSLEYCFCCKICKKIKNNKIENYQNLNNNQEEEEEEDNDDNDNNVEIIKNDDVYVKKFTNRVNGEIARKMYIFDNTFRSKIEEEDFFKKDDQKLKDGYFNNNYLKLNDYGGNIFYALFDKNTDDIICLLNINDKGNEKIILILILILITSNYRLL